MVATVNSVGWYEVGLACGVLLPARENATSPLPWIRVTDPWHAVAGSLQLHVSKLCVVYRLDLHLSLMHPAALAACFLEPFVCLQYGSAVQRCTLHLCRPWAAAAATCLPLKRVPYGMRRHMINDKRCRLAESASCGLIGVVCCA